MSYCGTYIIAEAGVNHNGSLEKALELVDVAVDAGANAVKFQTFSADLLVTKSGEKAEYQKRTTQKTETQYEMIKKLELDHQAHRTIMEYCRQKNIDFLSTPFDVNSTDFLSNELNVSRLKISSGDITNGPLLLHSARTQLPIILSTGMSTLGEVEAALGILAFGYIDSHSMPSSEGFKAAFISKEGQRILKEKVVLLHCTTEYPAPFTEINLKVIKTMQAAFALDVGYSDHTNGIAIPTAAVALGASVIEKHFTLDKTLPGPDHKASLEPEELKLMIKAIREVEVALGTGIKMPTTSEKKNITIARKSIVASKAIAKGDILTENNITVKRPGNGVSPMCYWEYLGKRADRDYVEDELIKV